MTLPVPTRSIEALRRQTGKTAVGFFGNSFSHQFRPFGRLRFVFFYREEVQSCVTIQCMDLTESAESRTHSGKCRANL